jgi:hypothetical protein
MDYLPLPPISPAIIAQATYNPFVGALPPQYQEAAERKTIASDPELVDRIGNSFYELVKNETGYLVVTDWCEIQIDIQYLPTNICGPARFALVYHDLQPKACTSYLLESE